ncbi:MAG: hypothetical protein HYW06_00595 [Gemmatimonadetes bacterium]|nr:hypothetical protein [Gemmatimonadota bacterium]
MNAQAMLAAHVTDVPEPVTKHRNTVPEAVNQLILRCLEKKPADRWQRADELLPHLEALLTPSGGLTPTGATPAIAVGIKRFTGVAALAVVLLAAGAFALLRPRDRDRPVDVTRVVVSQPEVASADPALTAIAAMTADAINAGLARLDWVQVAQPGAHSGAAATTTLSGQVYPLGDSVQLQLRVTEGRSGNLIRGLPPVRLRRDPGVEELKAAVSPALSLVGYVTHPLLGPPAVPAAGLPRFEAFMEVAAAIGVWLRTDTSAFFETMEHLRTGRRLDSSFAQAELWLAAHAVRSYRWPAFARELAWLLPVIERSNVQRSPFEAALARHAALGARGSVTGQLETLRQLAAIAPRSVFAWELPNHLLDLNRPREALGALDHLFRARGEGSHAWDEKDYWGARADILHFLGEYQAELTAARRARNAEPADIQHVRRELRALAALGKFAEVQRRLYEVEDAGGTNPFDFPGDVYLQLGQEMVAHGDTAAGRRGIRRAVDWFERRTASEWRSPHVRFRAALAYLTTGEAARALPIVEQLHREAPDDPRYLGTIGRVYAATGRTADAERVLQQLEAMPALLLAGAPTYERASISAILGRQSEAVSLLQESLRQGQGWGIRSRLHWFFDWLPYRDYPPFRRLITGQG